MAQLNDPLGRAAERIALNAFVVQTSSSIANWTGDPNGASDLRLKNSEASFRLNNLLSTSSGVLVNMAGTCFASFGLEKVST